MVAFRHTGLIFIFMLIMGLQLFAFPGDSGSWHEPDFMSTAQPERPSELKIPVTHFYYAIESTNYSQTIFEVHRLVSVLLLSNRIVPTNNNFRSIVFIPVAINCNSPVSIFIKGHSLRN